MQPKREKSKIGSDHGLNGDKLGERRFHTHAINPASPRRTTQKNKS